MRAPTENQIDTLISYLRGGSDVSTAAAQVGLDPREFNVWLRKPRQKGAREKVMRGLAQAHLTDLSTITNAANTRAEAASGTWQAAKARIDMRKDAEAERRVHEINAIAMGW